MTIIVTIIVATGLLLSAFILYKIAHMPKLLPKKSVLQYTQVIRDLFFTVQQQLINYKCDVLGFYYQVDENALAIRAKHILGTLSEIEANLKRFRNGYEPYAHHKSERHFYEIAKAYDTAVQQQVKLLGEILSDLHLIEQLVVKLQLIDKQAEPLLQYVNVTDKEKQSRLSEQLRILIKACQELTAADAPRPKLPLCNEVFNSIIRITQSLTDDYNRALHQLTTDSSQYIDTIGGIRPGKLFDSSSYNELMNHLLQQPQVEQYQQEIDKLYYQV